jgi:hypothetical protein
MDAVVLSIRRILHARRNQGCQIFLFTPETRIYSGLTASKGDGLIFDGKRFQRNAPVEPAVENLAVPFADTLIKQPTPSKGARPWIEEQLSNPSWHPVPPP